MTQSRFVTAALLAVSLFAASPASADVQVNSLRAPDTIANPSSIFTINYTLSGSSLLASAQIKFYLATSPTAGGYLLGQRQILLGSAGNGLYLPPTGTQSISFSYASASADAKLVFDSIQASCQPQTWYIQARVDFSTTQSDDTLIGTARQPDFYFTAGTLSPATIQPGGAANISFTLASQCPIYTQSTVGLFLADANYQLLQYIGPVNIGTGWGPFTLPPTSISFSAATPPGAYKIVLIADLDNVIAETNENNNAGAFSLNIVANALKAVGTETSPLTSDVPVSAGADEAVDYARMH